jgi:type II secretory pathway component PulC
VIRIARDRIFIRRNGQLEFIRLDETIGGDPSPVSVSPSNGGGGSGNNPAMGKAARALQKTGGGNDELVKDRSEQEFELSEETVEKKLEDKKEIAREVRTTANYEDGEKKGVKLVGVSPNSLYSELGFQTGDVLHSVGGREVDSGTDIQELIDELSQQDSVEVVVERNDNKQKRTYKLE